jgi:hypothetical protein
MEQTLETCRTEDDGQRQLVTKDRGAEIAPADVNQDARPEFDVGEGTFVLAQRDLAISASVDKVEDDSRQPRPCDHPNVLNRVHVLHESTLRGGIELMG